MGSRMKTGCLTCRKRKKKCDEKRPLCEFCVKRGIDCEWEIRNITIDMSGKMKREREPVCRASLKRAKTEIRREMNHDDRSDTRTKIGNSFGEEGRMKTYVMDNVNNVLNKIDNRKDAIDNVIHMDTNHIEGGILAEITSDMVSNTPLIESLLNKPLLPSKPDMGYSNLLDELLPTDLIPSQQDITPSILISPSSSFSFFLDEPGMVYLNYFENNVANMMSISPRSSNYFLKTFFTTSITNEVISNALAAWGALFYTQNADLVVVNHYFNKAKSLVNESPSDKHDYFITLAFYLISMGVQVCSGDTKNWYIIFNKCVALFKRYGGVVKFLHDFDYSNDCKFLISNFQFHDVTSSQTLANGTTCSMNSYNDLFKINKVLESDNYGIDPYQGCIQPIYLLLGEIMNTYVEIKGKSKSLIAKLNNFNQETQYASSEGGEFDFFADYESIPNIEPEPLHPTKETSLSLDILRLNHFKTVDEKYFALKNKISYCNPIKSQLQQLSTDEERNQHLKLFELYKITCEMYLALYIRQTQPISTEIQSHLLNSFNLIEELSNSNLIGSLNMSLLICGISCCNRFYRMKLKRLIDFVYSKYRVGNVKRIRDVVEESWRRNSTGNICIDWLEICNDFGWKLSMA